MSRKQEPRFIHLDAPRSGASAAGAVALVPGEDAPLLALQLPPGLQGNAREQVAWRQLQDQLGLTQGMVEMRPYCGAKTAISWTKVLVAATDHMQRWRHRLQPGCRALLPDYLALPAAEDLWVLTLREGTVQARLGLEDGFSAEADLADLMLTQRLADETQAKPKAVLLLQGEVPRLAALLGQHDIELLRDTADLAALEIPVPVVLGHGELSADLRIDAGATRRQLRRQLLPWVAAGLAGALMLGIWATGEGLKIAQIQRDHTALQANVDTLVREYFVPTGPLLDVRLQVSRALAARQSELAVGDAGRVSPLLLLGQVADVISATGAAPEQVIYSQAEGLVVALRLADFAVLGQLVTALEQAGIAVEQRSARVVEGTSGGVRAELHLQPQQAEVGQ